MNRPIAATAALTLSLLSARLAAQTPITANFAVSSTLTLANSPYTLLGDIYVLPGATLTIEAGVEFRSSGTSSLIVTRGAQIFANGTVDEPIVFTSDLDTGSYRQDAAGEWGNLSVLGAAYVSTNAIATNSAVPSSNNFAEIEGMAPGISQHAYGGGDDDDDSGTLSFCSIRYSGFIRSTDDERNGLALGGVGRGTDIHHIEVLNDIDDGIEIWGGTVHVRYVSVWNVGDDCFDVDQGWRGRAQFGLLVQGASSSGGTQGTGFGDNAIELDGAEFCDWQPVTTCAIHNFTVIGGSNAIADPGNPAPTDNLVEFADNARAQFLNCMFLDAGKEVLNDRVSTFVTAACGPASNVPAMVSRMTTAATTTFAMNAFPGGPEATPAEAYTAQAGAGNLVEFRGGIYFNNNAASAYLEALNYGLFAAAPLAGTNHADNTIAVTQPITELTRSATAFASVGHSLFPVTFLDPTPTPAAQTAAEFSPANGFYTAARYAGAFARGNNWLVGWTGASRYGLTTSSLANQPIHGFTAPGVGGDPVHHTDGSWQANTQVTLRCSNAADLTGQSVGVLVWGLAVLDLSLLGGTVYPTPDFVSLVVGPPGELSFPTFTVPAGLSGTTYHTQFLTFDPGVPIGEFAFSNAQRHILP